MPNPIAPSLTAIREYSDPLLQCYGDADRIVPYTSGIKRHDTANEPKLLITIPGSGFRISAETDSAGTVGVRLVAAAVLGICV